MAIAVGSAKGCSVAGSVFFDGIMRDSPTESMSDSGFRALISSTVTPYLFERYRMPYFQNNSTTTHPAEAGLEVDEKYVFNNSVYMGVSQTTAGNIGFSYYY